jgi:hypothetical protein
VGTSMTTQTEVQPATEFPRDAKPSEIVRSWPESRWCKGAARKHGLDGNIRYCAIGILAEEGGADWDSWADIPGSTSHLACRFVAKTYDMPHTATIVLMAANDGLGKDAAADYLEQLGY